MKSVLLSIFTVLLVPVNGHAAADPQLDQGGKIYDYYCYQCHGYAGDARTLAANYLNPAPRNFTAARKSSLSKERMYTSISQGRSGTAMVSFANVLSAQQIDAVIHYIQATFMTDKPAQRRYHTAENGWPDHQRYQSAFSFVSGDIDIDIPELQLTPQQQQGRQLFLSACISCHDRFKKLDESPVWEPRAVSFPRNPNLPHLGKAGPVDSMSGATPFSKHDQIPVIIGLTPDEQAGQRLFQVNCAFCHAADGTGKNWIGTFMRPPARDLTRSGLIRDGADRAIIIVIQNGLTNTSMPAWKNILSEKEIGQVLAYIRRALIHDTMRQASSSTNTASPAKPPPSLTWQPTRNTIANH